VIRRVLFPAVLAASLTLSVGGCALLSTPDPVQTYRFGASSQAETFTPVTAQPVAVVLRRLTLPEATRGDRLLGVTGTETAYIKGARWISSAETLFDDSLRAAFTGQTGKVRLLGGRDVSTADLVMGLEVTAFEVRYPTPGTAVVTIEARGRLTRLPERSAVEDRTFKVEVPAAENRVSAIVQAFDAAVLDFNGQVVDWVDSRPAAAR
jgi:cholesterol transport system auxiliary component